jgi:ABC-2 type transport system ATP-binding protein
LNRKTQKTEKSKTRWFQVMPSESAIEVSELTKCYGKLLAVDHINFTVKKGEIFGFLGPNGAGKTTTINILTGVTQPTSGSAFISGFNVAHEPVKAKEQVGVVPETSFLYDEMTALDNINFSAKLHSVPKTRRTVFSAGASSSVRVV